ncbi:MAG: hypothetical protein U0T83_05895 [Bacteriovoracaceae bacterium]
MRASIDIGSNSVILAVGEFDKNRKFTSKLDHLEITSLGRELDKYGSFHPESMQNTFNTLNIFKKELEAFQIKPSEVIAVSTEAARVAKNRATFFDKIKNEIGFNVQILSGKGEAHYAALGATLGKIKNQSPEILIMDIGGASTEFIKIQREPFKIINSISLPVGVVRATDWIQNSIYSEKLLAIKEKFSTELKNMSSPYLLCIAGTMTSIALMHKNISNYDETLVNGSTISANELMNLRERIQKMTLEEIDNKYPFLKKRVPFIKAGFMIGTDLGQTLGTQNFEISSFGLRHGVLFCGTIAKEFLHVG